MSYLSNRMAGANEEIVPKTMQEYLYPNQIFTPSCIVTPSANVLSVKSGMLQVLPHFHGLASENPCAHIIELEELCMSDTVVLLKIFPSSLKDKAESWFHSLNPRSILTWQDMEEQFFKEFSPMYETHMLLREIVNFYQLDEESFAYCWWRFKYPILYWSQHSYEIRHLIPIFYDSLNSTTRQLVERMFDGAFLDRTANESWDYFDELAESSESWVYDVNVEDATVNVVEEDIESPIFVEDVSLTYESSTESDWSDEPNDEPVVQYSPPVDLLPCDDPGEKLLTIAEMDAEIDYLYSLLEEQDKAYETKSGSPTLEDTNFDAREKEHIEPLVIREGYMPFEESLSIVALNNQTFLALDDATPPAESPLSQEFLKVELIDFLGVDEFDLVYHPYIVDFVNTLKIDLVWNMHLVELKFIKRIRQMRYSKYLILWHGRVQFLVKSIAWSALFFLIVINGVPNVRSMCAHALGSILLLAWLRS